MKAYIGTSGWSYYSFKGILYPVESKPKDWLSIYAKHFNTVEVNVTFYRLPSSKTFEKWYAETPEDFVFSLKAPKIITHVKRLKEVLEDLREFLKRIAVLKEKAKVLLFQFPPSLKFEKNLIENFLKVLPSDYLMVIEIRNQSFHTEEFVDMVREKGICLCFSDCGKRYPSWYEVQTTDFLYVRLHGREKLYVSKYKEEELKALVKSLKRFEFKELFVYFDNTALGHAVTDALTFKSLVEV
ncbi:DUF72 domain-containing protein [Thermodesulfobacterium sp. TA1]|uniref:DUF72 domain-containing protein n=1 Tax=Thermodesulfobacterium sp. TA1 TaxID=2234087 RepID=UPI001232CC0B|nr:DUF72 domain-containing protein [Thermodesulfobacterium sp. TA1]QER41326.1 DUF72 domain-containing protein [Thermodesulfobacterium sp. TA1]